MIKIERRPRETNQQLIRRFNSALLQDGALQEFKDRQYFVRQPSRNLRRQNSLRVAALAQKRQRY